MAFLFDSHAHLDDPKFDDDRKSLITGLSERGIGAVLNPGADRVSSLAAVDLARSYDDIYAAVGTHPHEAAAFTEDDYRLYLELIESGAAVAIGEIGLDYFYENSPREIQQRVFRRQMELAVRTSFPVLIHSREADADTYRILSEFSGVRGVMHCYSGSVEMAKRYLDLGYYISLAGPVTFKNARVPKEVAAFVPIDRLMIETDSPYLSPEPRRGKRNDPGNLSYIAETIANIRGISYDELAERTSENTRKLYGIV